MPLLVLLERLVTIGFKRYPLLPDSSSYSTNKQTFLSFFQQALTMEANRLGLKLWTWDPPQYGVIFMISPCHVRLGSENEHGKAL